MFPPRPDDPRDWPRRAVRQSGARRQGPRLRHHLAGEGEDPGRHLQERAALLPAGQGRPGPGVAHGGQGAADPAGRGRHVQDGGRV